MRRVRRPGAPDARGVARAATSRNLGTASAVGATARGLPGSTLSSRGGMMIGSVGGGGPTMSLSERLRKQEELETMSAASSPSKMSGGTTSKVKAPRSGGPIMDDRRPPRSAEFQSFANDDSRYPQQHFPAPTGRAFDCTAPPALDGVGDNDPWNDHRDDKKCTVRVKQRIDHLTEARRRNRGLRVGISVLLVIILVMFVRNTLREDDGRSAVSARADGGYNPFGGGDTEMDKDLLFSSDIPPPGGSSVDRITSDGQRSQQRPPGSVVEARLPRHLDYLSNLTLPFHPGRETPYFWDVHFSGETVAEAIFGQCHNLVQACEHGMRQPHYNDDKLEVFHVDGVPYINVDTTTPDGIDRAGRLGLTKSGLADVIISPHLHLMSSKVFNRGPTGRMFALFRHPIDRAMTMYYYLSKASWDPMYNPKLAKMTVEEYAQSGHIENNWVTRFLVNKPGGKLTKEDMLLAKCIVKYKCLVGLYNDLEASMARFHRYFGWNEHDTKERKADILKCRKALVETGDKRMQHKQLDKGSEAWNLIENQNKFDMELYEFSKRIFRVQGEQIFNVVT